jgi:hypothetical protein
MGGRKGVGMLVSSISIDSVVAIIGNSLREEDPRRLFSSWLLLSLMVID